jgi:L-fuculose-phosphate aldolase
MNKKLISAAQKEICAAGLRLVKEGLVARTWGNISVRIDENTMAITPSGVKYEDVRPELIVIINLEDGSYEGSVKPSGERKLHSEIYRNRSELGAIIHTHQLNASVCSAARIEVPVVSASDRKSLAADLIRCGAYGLPGTKKLTTETASAIKGALCALMANHGAVCMGKNIDEAFTVSRILEKVCGEYISKSFRKAAGLKNAEDETICSHYEQHYAIQKGYQK